MNRNAWAATLANVAARRPWLALGACLAIGASVSVLLGQDANWDLLNYHLYNPWAWLHGRLHTDLAVAGPQTWFNPLLDVPYYWMASGPLGHWPRLVAAAQGFWYGALIFVVWRIAVAQARAQSRAIDIGDIAALALGVTGSAVIAQVGTTFNEIPLAVLVLTALLLLLRNQSDAAPARTARGMWRTGLAGALAGLAAGLKPTAILYLPAFGLALLLRAPRGRRWSQVGIFTGAAAAAFLIAYGWWGWWLYRTTGNPVFPLFNNFFHSGWSPPVNGTDARFRPGDAWQWLFYPFYWTLHASGQVSEQRMLDGRFAFAWLAGAAMLLQWCMRKARRIDAPVAPAVQGATESFLLLFILAAYVCWLVVFSIYRYTIPIEALTGFVIVMAARRAGTVFGTGMPERWRRVTLNVAVALALLLIAGTHHPDWGRVAYAERVFEVRVRPLPGHSLVLFVDQPSSYLAPFFRGQDLDFIGVTWFTGAARGYRLWSMTQRRIQHHRGPLFAVLSDAETSQRGMLPLLGLVLTSDCVPVQSNLQAPSPDTNPDRRLRICRLLRADEHTSTAADAAT